MTVADFTKSQIIRKIYAWILRFRHEKFAIYIKHFIYIDIPFLLQKWNYKFASTCPTMCVCWFWPHSQQSSCREFIGSDQFVTLAAWWTQCHCVGKHFMDSKYMALYVFSYARIALQHLSKTYHKIPYHCCSE